MDTNVCPKTWLVESILVTLFCCLPLGIAGIVYASKVSTLYAEGKYEEACRASEEAKKWTHIGFFLGLALALIYVLFYGGIFLTFLNNAPRFFE